jgi:hypothetical protein
MLASFVKLRNLISREVKGRSWEETTVGEEFPTGNLKSIHVLWAKVREGPGDRDHSPRSGEGCVTFSDFEVEEEAGHDEGEVTAEDASTERLIKAIARMSLKTKMDIPIYEGNLDGEELLDWI